MHTLPLAGIRKRKVLLQPLIAVLVRVWLACLLAALAACSSTQTSVAPLGQASFALYQAETRQWLEEHRHFQGPDKAAELDWNMPQEWRPAGVPSKGVLLVHGLGDSPWSFCDLGPELARQGFLVRSVLLPGHGTQPADLMHPSLADWRQVVREQAAILAREVAQIYLGGFSTGANLVVDYALDNPEVAGLLLFSPAFKSDSAYDWVTPWIAWARPWLRIPDANRPQQTPVRYLNTPTNGFAQFYRSSAAVRSGLARKTYDKPALLVTVRHDSVLDVRHTLETFTKRFTHPSSRLVWYGSLPEGTSVPPRVLVRSDYLPEQRISQFSHMGVLFSPRNPLYGEQGGLRLCWNGQDEDGLRQCMEGAQVWYSAWGYREPGKIHARLTFNPYFDWQAEVMAQVLKAAEKDAMQGGNDARCALSVSQYSTLQIK
ncbi:alpha/beta hydrolase [Desulfocurvibacter africanus]|uniref:Carboxylesterase n=1 Tax=Desulfocurvibacter africanus subsp. africanus str. Walvis Bay TaxID=690850 RepID=F3YX64_DESAF|nr:alpha/beta fold hydrolase [Desulfocurvibacter africanus]EGJ49452.1 carboxylesterase [Desulfocurvibacter africanus subsp. africanus str. Walvis Bay]